MPKNLYITAVLLFLTYICAGQDTRALESSIEEKYGVEIVWNVHVTDSWRSVSYSNPDPEKLIHYLELLQNEMKKYSSEYFNAIKLEKIVLGNDLAFSGQARAAIPDPYKGVMYYSANGAYNNSSITYLTHCFHHELQHYTEYSIWGSMTYDWAEWYNLNIDGFQYGSGGASAYSDLNTDYYSPVHPEKGFMNLYSMTGDEEDRCEIIAFYFTDTEKNKTIELLSADDILMKKYKLLANLVNKVTGEIILPTDPR